MTVGAPLNSGKDGMTPEELSAVEELTALSTFEHLNPQQTAARFARPTSRSQLTPARST